MNVVQTIPFHDLSLSALLVNGSPYVAVRPICEALGISEAGQRQRIRRDPELKACACVIHAVAEDGRNRKMLCLPLDRLNGWLFGVDVARVREDLRERMAWYRRECFDVLARHFGLGGGKVASLREQLQQAEADERRSFTRASEAGRAMNQRRKDKPALRGRIADLCKAVQLALPLEGGAA